MCLDNKISTLITIIRGLIHDQLCTDGRTIAEYENDLSFPLCRDYIDADSIVVCINNDVLNDQDWQFNSTKNVVTIDIISSGVSITKGDKVTITYNYYGKYSDAVLKQYIQSSFAYFAEYRYKKIFCIDSNDCVVAINNTIPNKREVYFICIIASILIDPQNLKIRTDEFTISANREKSDSEQIADAFFRYQSFIGIVDNITKDHNRGY